MSSGVKGPVHNRRSMNSEHRRHDRLLVARFAADDSYPGEFEAAQALVAGCAECAALVDDIRLLSVAVAAVPTPRRPRDFRLTAEQAERLRGSWLERLMRRLAAPSSAMLRPVAGVAMSIGLVLAVVGAMPAGFSAANPVQEVGPTSQEVAAAPSDQPRPDVSDMNIAPEPGNPQQPASAPTEMYMSGDPAPSTVDGSGNGEQVPFPSVDPVTRTLDDAYIAGGEADAGTAGRDASQTFAVSTDTLLYAGLLIAMASLAFLLLIIYARRRYADPYVG